MPLISPGSIVVGIDGSDMSDRALDWAIDQARLERRPLTLVHAIDRSSVDGTLLRPHDAADGQALLDQGRDRAISRDPEAVVNGVLCVEDPRQALLDLSHDATLVVLGSHGRGPIRSLLLGSVSVAVSRHAGCPVVIVRPHHPGTVRRGILVGADGTARSLPALEFAYSQASFRSLPLTAMHCFQDEIASTATPQPVSATEPRLEATRLLLAESISGLSEKYPDVHVTRQLMRGLPADCLIQASGSMDLLVVGWHARHRLTGFLLGAAAPSVIEHARCVVAVVQGEA